MRHLGHAIMIAWRASHGSGGLRPPAASRSVPSLLPAATPRMKGLVGSITVWSRLVVACPHGSASATSRPQRGSQKGASPFDRRRLRVKRAPPGVAGPYASGDFKGAASPFDPWRVSVSPGGNERSEVAPPSACPKSASLPVLIAGTRRDRALYSSTSDGDSGRLPVGDACLIGTALLLVPLQRRSEI